MERRRAEAAHAQDRRARPDRLSPDEKLDWLRLIRSENVGPVTFHELLTHFGSAGAALDAIPELSARGGMRRCGRICSEADAIRELERAARADVDILALVEADYPLLLKHVEGAPPLVYAKGVLGLAQRRAVAIVGSRSASSAGRQFASDLARDLGIDGIAISSGLARGIDTAAHVAAIPTGTIAVVAGGVDVVYPPENADLHADIAERGLLLSECPLGFSPRGQDFPRRNRIISGVSVAVVVVEAAQHSGSLITARLALEQNREVFAVPGHPLDPRAVGTNTLIKNGARLITCAADILADLPPQTNYRGMQEPPPPPQALSPPPKLEEPSEADRRKVVEALSLVPVHADTVLRMTGLSPRRLAVILLELDIAGRIERHGDQHISLKL